MEKFIAMGTVGIARESGKILLQYFSFLTPIAVVLIFPYSAATLTSRTFFGGLEFTARLAVRLQAVAQASGFPDSRLLELICYRISQATVSCMLCFPLMVTFSLVAKAAVVHTVAMTNAGHKPSVPNLVKTLPITWTRVLITYSYTVFLVTSSNAVLLVFLLMWPNVAGALGVPLATWMLYLGAAGGVLYCLAFAHAMMVCNLATLVSAVEDTCGVEALYRATCLIRGRTEIALVVSLFTNLSLASVEVVFQHRAVRAYECYRSYACFWEGPLLIFVYSMLGLLENVMSSVFYYACKSSNSSMEGSWQDCSIENAKNSSV